ncbi:hypothetical protein EBU99_00340 [bacterium]|nr:hypothetical protein [bacterium]
MSKIIIDSTLVTPSRISEPTISSNQFHRTEEAAIAPAARVIGQPEGPFGTAAVSQNTVLIRSLGAARFVKFMTLEIAPHGLFIVVPQPQTQPFQAKSTLLEIQLFLGEPASAGNKIIKCIGRIEEIRSAVDVPHPTPAGYIVRLVQLSAEDVLQIEKHINEKLINTAI